MAHHEFTMPVTEAEVRLAVWESSGSNALVAAAAWSDEGIHKPNSANNGTQVDTQSVAA